MLDTIEQIFLKFAVRNTRLNAITYVRCTVSLVANRDKSYTMALLLLRLYVHFQSEMRPTVFTYNENISSHFLTDNNTQSERPLSVLNTTKLRIFICCSHRCSFSQLD